MAMERGIYTVVDGLDGIGKGEIERAMRGIEERSHRVVFDTIAHSKAWEELPELKDFLGIPVPHYNALMVAEPTFEGIGKVIREEIIAKNGRDYSADVQVELYSCNRLVLMKRVVAPALENGFNVISSRGVDATFTYQSLKAKDEGKNPKGIKKRILNHEGNILQLNLPIDLLVIATMFDVSNLETRLLERGKTRKDDNSEFENIEFQGRLKPLFESEELRKLFEGYGTKVAYVDAGVSEEFTRQQAVEIYKHFLHKREVQFKYSHPPSVKVK